MSLLLLFRFGSLVIDTWTSYLFKRDFRKGEAETTGKSQAKVLFLAKDLIQQAPMRISTARIKLGVVSI